MTDKNSTTILDKYLVTGDHTPTLVLGDRPMVIGMVYSNNSSIHGIEISLVPDEFADKYKGLGLIDKPPSKAIHDEADDVLRIISNNSQALGLLIEKLLVAYENLRKHELTKEDQS